MNLELYNKVRDVPLNAQKEIKGGRLNGKTDINPMWRIKTLTEQFGPCGIGWKYVITEKRLEPGPGGEVAAFVDINLYFRYEGEWSEAVPGTGGSAFVAKEKSGLYTSDECFKMALTDAISVACKALGIGADVYWDTDKSKYDRSREQAQEPPKTAASKGRKQHSTPGMLTKAQMQELVDMSVKQWGAKDAGAHFAEYTGYRQPSEVPAAEFEKVKQAIVDALPF